MDSLKLEACYQSLNAAQLEAVMHDQGPLLIIAGAGSGKTKTLVHRVARLILSGIAPEHILLLTFTRKSAQEMMSRASGLTSISCSTLSGGTFHSFCHLFLRQHATCLGFTPEFTILDRLDGQDVIAWVRQQRLGIKLDKRFPKKNILADIFGKIVNLGCQIGPLLEDSYPQFLDFSEDIERLFHLYRQAKRDMHMMDYDDLMVHTVDILEQHPSVRQKTSAFYRHILVDEYQDTNDIQAKMIGLLSNAEQNVCAVGDDAQSIYSFRGANYKNILSFPNQFLNTKLVFLEQNYRSVQPILDLTNAVISRSKNQYNKSLFTQKKGGSLPVYLQTDSENMQSKFICQKILSLREEGVALKEMAVLVRSGWHSNDLEIELGLHGIPFVKVGGFKFVEMAHVKDMLALLRIVSNPVDQLAWNRVLMLIEQVGPKASQDIVRAIARKECQLLAKKTYYQDVLSLNAYFQGAQGMPLGDIVCKAMAWYAPYFERVYDDYKKRQVDLDSFVTISGRYQSLELLLSEMSLDPPTSMQDVRSDCVDDELPVTVSTIHSAKGLEWHTVFVLSAIDGYIPSLRSLNDASSLEEERRLLYVAMTRAKQGLFVIHPHMDTGYGNFRGRSGFHFSSVSRFLAEGNILTRFTDRCQLVEDRQVSLDSEVPVSQPPDYRKYYF